MSKVCLVEDEQDLLDILSVYLKNNGWEVIPCHNLKCAKENIDSNIDLWVLDILLPDGSGIEILKEIKKKFPDKPVILMSARGDSIDRVLGFEVGCDDYISKPFLPTELIYRANKYLTISTQLSPSKIEYFSNYSIDRQKRLIFTSEEQVILTTKEYNVILYFLDNSSIAVSREILLNKIWGYDYYGNDRVVDNYIKKIRKKLPDFNIETIYGFGYRCNL